MSFYGTIGNTNHIHFQFDKIYPNRTAMDLACQEGTDNIYQGRFVLVKYDNSDSIFTGEILYGFMKNSDEHTLYLDRDTTTPYTYTDYSSLIVNYLNQENIKENYFNYYQQTSINGQTFYLPLTNADQVKADKRLYYKVNNSLTAVGINTIIYRKNISTEIFDGRFYICTGKAENSDNAVWELISDYETYGDYLSNFQTDAVSYGAHFDPRGYDATVWEKIYSEGTGKFIQIARLNGSVPAIEIIADKPTILPATAYIDAKSSPELYSIHAPSHWGFRFKESMNNTYPPSEQSVIQQYYDESTQEPKNVSINADIYLNLKSANPKEYYTYDSAGTNEVLIQPTGYSGKKYNGQVEQDTYELSVHLPAVGNMVSDGYDLIYGRTENEDPENRKKIRPRDIQWYDGNMSTAIKENGDINLGGKSHDLNTLAGTLNTMHDRLGQKIIMRNSLPSEEEIQQLDSTYIYGITDSQNNTTYYRKGIDYQYQEIAEFMPIEMTSEKYEQGKYYIWRAGNSYELATQPYTSYNAQQVFYERIPNFEIYTEVIVTQEEYEPNTYFVSIRGTSTYTPATESYSYYLQTEAINYYKVRDNKVIFYKRNISMSKFHEIELLKYEQDKYYYYNPSTKDYLLDHKAHTPTYQNSLYYDIEVNYAGNSIIPTGDILSKRTFAYEYGASQYYKRTQNSNNTYNYRLDISSVPSSTDSYYRITSSNQGGTLENLKKVLYQPNKYYYLKNDVPVLATDDFFDLNKAPYYYIPLSEETIYVQDPNTNNIIVGHPLDQNKAHWIRYTANEMFSYQNINELYIKEDNNFIHVSQITDLSQKYHFCTLTSVTDITNHLFIPNKYYTHDNDGFHFAKTYINSSTEYYELKPLQSLKTPFYYPDKYWYNNGNIFLIDSGLDKTDNRTYYTESSLYVLYDSSERFAQGYEWKNQALYVPASVTLALRKEKYALYPLNGINNGESSLNGLIHTASNIIANTDPDTREENTLQGALNRFSDNFSLVSTMYPNRLLYINDFGQITATSISLLDLKELFNRVSTLESQ